MGGDRYTISQRLEETWQQRITRIRDDTRDTIAATRKVIDSSLQALAAADENLKRHP